MRNEDAEFALTQLIYGLLVFSVERLVGCQKGNRLHGLHCLSLSRLGVLNLTVELRRGISVRLLQIGNSVGIQAFGRGILAKRAAVDALALLNSGAPLAVRLLRVKQLAPKLAHLLSSHIQNVLLQLNLFLIAVKLLFTSSFALLDQCGLGKRTTLALADCLSVEKAALGTRTLGFNLTAELPVDGLFTAAPKRGILVRGSFTEGAS